MRRSRFTEEQIIKVLKEHAELRVSYRSSKARLGWHEELWIDLHYTAPGKPMQNGFVESFNACCTTNALTSNCLRGSRPRTSLSGLTPTKFAIRPDFGPNSEQSLLLNEEIGGQVTNLV